MPHLSLAGGVNTLPPLVFPELQSRPPLYMRFTRCSCDAAAEHSSPSAVIMGQSPAPHVSRAVCNPACTRPLRVAATVEPGRRWSQHTCCNHLNQAAGQHGRVCVRLGIREPPGGVYCKVPFATQVHHQADSPTACVAALTPPAQQHSWTCCWVRVGKVTHPPHAANTPRHTPTVRAHAG